MKCYGYENIDIPNIYYFLNVNDCLVYNIIT